MLSAGTCAAQGFPASMTAAHVMAEKGVDIGAHRSRPVTRELVDMSTALVTMTASQRDEIVARFPGARGKVFTLGSLSADPSAGDVPDPVGMGEGDYRMTRDRIDGMLPDMILFLNERGK